MFVAWPQLAETARALFPESFRSFDAAVAGRFPFSQEAIEAAHARWTVDWLAWERQQGVDCKDKAALAEIELETASEWSGQVSEHNLLLSPRRNCELIKPGTKVMFELARQLQL